MTSKKAAAADTPTTDTDDPIIAILNDPKAVERGRQERLRKQRLRAFSRGRSRLSEAIDALENAWNNIYPQVGEVCPELERRCTQEEHHTVWAGRLKRWGDAVRACGWQARKALRTWQPPENLSEAERYAADFTYRLAVKMANPKCTVANIEKYLNLACTETNAELLDNLHRAGRWLSHIHHHIEGAVKKWSNLNPPQERRAVETMASSNPPAESDQVAKDGEQVASAAAGDSQGDTQKPLPTEAAPAMPTVAPAVTSTKDAIIHGPFGLDLDPENRIASRIIAGTKKEVHFLGKRTPWEMLRLLCKQYPTMFKLSALGSAAKSAAGEKTGLRNHLGTLRRLLQPLKIGIETPRTLGIRLQELPDAQAKPTKPEKKKPTTRQSARRRR